jgi:hypothetical protein
VTPNPDVSDFFAIPAGAHKDIAGTLNFYTLLYVNGLFGFREAVTHHPCGGASRGGAGGWVFAIRIDRSGTKTHAGITGVPRDIVEARVGPQAL